MQETNEPSNAPFGASVFQSCCHKMTSRETKKGVAIDNILYLNDGLWQATAPKVEVADERKSTGKNKKKQNDAKPEQDEEEVNFDDEDL